MGNNEETYVPESEASAQVEEANKKGFERGREVNRTWLKGMGVGAVILAGGLALAEYGYPWLREDVNGISLSEYVKKENYESRINSYEGKFKLIEEDIDSLREDFSGLERRVRGHNIKINSLNEKITQMTPEYVLKDLPWEANLVGNLDKISLADDGSAKVSYSGSNKSEIWPVDKVKQWALAGMYTQEELDSEEFSPSQRSLYVDVIPEKTERRLYNANPTLYCTMIKLHEELDLNKGGFADNFENAKKRVIPMLSSDPKCK